MANETPKPAERVAGKPTVSWAAGKNGMTLVEVLIALAVAAVLITGMMDMFSRQSATYTREVCTASLQQNLRAAMTVIARDIRSAGHYTAADIRRYPHWCDWNPVSPGKDDVFPVVQGVDDISGIAGYRDGSDVIMIVRASPERGALKVADAVLPGDRSLDLDCLDLDRDGDIDLNNSGRRFGVLVAADLTRCHLFEIVNREPGRITMAAPFDFRFDAGDTIARLDIILYRVDSANPTFGRSVLARKNLGRGSRFQVVAEDIVDLQCSYVLSDGRRLDSPDGLEHLVCAVQVTLAAEAGLAGGAIIRRQLTSEMMIRNIAYRRR